VILDEASPCEVKGIDPSESYIAFAREQVADERASFTVGDAQALAIDSAQYDAVVSGLVLNFVPQPGRAMTEMARSI
jgi:ubiquinone/menaquinone biosynthesis C-methylase UbiE